MLRNGLCLGIISRMEAIPTYYGETTKNDSQLMIPDTQAREESRPHVPMPPDKLPPKATRGLPP